MLLLLFFFLHAPALSRAEPPSFGATWSCRGTATTIDNYDGVPCRIPAFTLTRTDHAFAWEGRLQCVDGTDVSFAEAFGLEGESVLDPGGKIIGTESATTFVAGYQAAGLDYATSLRLDPATGQLRIQHDRSSGGVPILRWIFDCSRALE